MTRKSERELESAVTDLEPHSNDAPGFRYVVAFEGRRRPVRDAASRDAGRPRSAPNRRFRAPEP
ncbi:hypothetical protein ACFQL0_22155 [Haloplanus litoreus]|uniref:hypothetical protein n=1 Tax=Haloplanus litoreus TaxID=767515 RepID=UPI003613A23B